MNINRNIERLVKFVLDECLPPFLRDNKLVMWLPFRLVFGDKAKFFLDFKEQAGEMSEDSISEIYTKTKAVRIQQEGTDLSDLAMREIESNVLGNNVLDVGCGKGILANHLSNKFTVTACDIFIHEGTTNRFPEIQFQEANITNLPFRDDEFDTVICAHTLEHIWDISYAINEIRRVARKRLIVVVPKERPFRYTFNLHLHFFPYKYLVIQRFQPRNSEENYKVKEIDGCWFYQEDTGNDAID